MNPVRSGTAPTVLPLSIGDGDLCETSVTAVSVPEMFRYWLQGGRITIGFLVRRFDKFGNINTTVIGGYEKPKTRLPGAGAPEIASSCGEIYITMAQSTRGMVDKIDFVTSFGHREGGDHRERLGIATKGSTLLIKDLAIWRPDTVTKEFTVMSLHPGVTERMCRRLAVEGQFAENLDVTPAPSELELKTLRDLKARTDAAHKGESSIAAAPLPTTAQRRELSSRCAIEEVEGLTTLIIR